MATAVTRCAWRQRGHPSELIRATLGHRRGKDDDCKLTETNLVVDSIVATEIMIENYSHYRLWIGLG